MLGGQNLLNVRLGAVALAVGFAVSTGAAGASTSGWQRIGASKPAAAAHASTKQARPASRVRLNALEGGVLASINSMRAQHGLRALRASAPLSNAAAQHSREMAAKGYFAHESANGAAFWKRVQHFYAQGSYGHWTIGENLLWSSPDIDAAGALDMWMKSPPHRANLLDKGWREIGLSAVHVESSASVFGGGPVTIVTADFGARY
jgi:uncharacterized protein YkwD